MGGLSNAQSLRVIGQDLAALGIDVFNLGRKRDEYTVWIEETKSVKMLIWEKTFTGKIVPVTLGSNTSAKEIPNPMRFKSSQLLWADVARRFNRTALKEITDLNELSLLLRVLGNFLDKHQTDDFIIFWSKELVKVVFDNREQNFTMLNLYDVGTHMYLKRANRRLSQ